MSNDASDAVAKRCVPTAAFSAACISCRIRSRETGINRSQNPIANSFQINANNSAADGELHAYSAIANAMTVSSCFPDGAE